MNKLNANYISSVGQVLETITIDASDWRMVRGWMRSLLSEVLFGEDQRSEYVVLFRLANLNVEKHRIDITLNQTQVRQLIHFISLRINHCEANRELAKQHVVKGMSFEFMGQTFSGDGYNSFGGVAQYNEPTMKAMTYLRQELVNALIGPVTFVKDTAE